jgi:hypothetical protein
MKRKIFNMTLRTVSLSMFLAFLFGIAWSLFPLFGTTLPHHIEKLSGSPFKWSALLVSAVLGILCMGSIGLSAVIMELKPHKSRRDESC